VAAAEPRQELPADQGRDGCANEQQAPEGLRAVEAERMAEG
jgi:hypothetical protein